MACSHLTDVSTVKEKCVCVSQEKVACSHLTNVSAVEEKENFIWGGQNKFYNHRHL